MTTQEPTPDMSAQSCAALNALMLAQAQEAFYKKATIGSPTFKAAFSKIKTSVQLNNMVDLSTMREHFFYQRL